MHTHDCISLYHCRCGRSYLADQYHYCRLGNHHEPEKLSLWQRFLQWINSFAIN